MSIQQRIKILSLNLTQLIATHSPQHNMLKQSPALPKTIFVNWVLFWFANCIFIQTISEVVFICFKNLLYDLNLS